MKKKIVSVLGFVVIAVVGCTYDKGEVAKPSDPVVSICELVSYSRDIAPVMTEHCISCHNSSYTGYDLSTYNGVKQKALNGTLRNRVLVIKDMPGYCPLATEDAKKLDCWINKGAPDN